jgi:curli biogenesis system outer membrane secretion channel CsgG
MRKGILKKLFIISLMFMIGCATTVKVKLLKPAEINLGARKKIAVLNFALDGDFNKFDYRLYYNESYSKSKISDDIIQSLIANQHYIVVERDQLSRVLSEQGLSATAFTDKNETIKLGKLFGVDALMVGSGEFRVNDTIERTDQTKTLSDRTIYYKEAKIHRDINVNVTYRIIDTSTGEIIVSRNVYGNQSSSTPFFPEKGTERVEYNTGNPVYNDPFKQPGNNPVYNDPFNKYPASPEEESYIDYDEVKDRFSTLDD